MIYIIVHVGNNINRHCVLSYYNIRYNIIPTILQVPAQIHNIVLYGGRFASTLIQWLSR